MENLENGLQQSVYFLNSIGKEFDFKILCWINSKVITLWGKYLVRIKRIIENQLLQVQYVSYLETYSF